MYTKEKRRLYRLANKEKFAAYSRKYNKTVKGKESKKRYESKPEVRRALREKYIPHPKVRNYIISEKELFKKKVRAKTRRALNKGLIKRLPCRECGSLKAEAHHNNYLEPLNVAWLCRKHHVARHKEIGSYTARHSELSPSR